MVEEERVLTVFADVHYYFNAPTPRPLSHRFDKGSYLYLHRSPHGGRLEIANNVGKPEQDAFTGSLDSVTIRQSHKHPTLVTVTVDGFEGHNGAVSPHVQCPEHHWRLPNTDPRNEGKFLFRLHTLDIYFWTSEDASSFLDILGKVLQPQQLEILDRPQPLSVHEQMMSPVVQQLENVAIQDPAYHNGQTKSSKSMAQTFLPPPIVQDDVQKAPTVEDSKAFQPLAYNPASPPAPEIIKHREKTPPPPESETGTGLAEATYHDSSQPRMQSPLSSQPRYGQSPVSQGYIGSHQSQAPNSSYTSPIPSTGYINASASVSGHRTSSVSTVPPAPPFQANKTSSSPFINDAAYTPPPHGPASSAASHSSLVNTSFGPPPKDLSTPALAKDPRRPDSPTSEILGNSYVGGPQQPLQHLQPQYADYLETRHQSQPPEGGYSNYQYQQPHHHHKHHSQTADYDVHGQVYKPTEEEAHKHKHRRPSENTGQQPGRLEQKAEKVEKGLGRLFKKVEKKIG